MFFDQPMVLHSKLADGRHWFTTLDFPPLQIWPVARNHCRAGQFLANLLSARLPDFDGDIPGEITLSRADVAAATAFAGRYPELKTEEGEVRIRLVMQAGPEGSEEELEEEDEASEFITPQPPLDWTGNYDQWIVHVGRSLGVDVPDPDDESNYDKAMADAVADLQGRLPSLRECFLAGMGGLNLGFKVGLTTRKGGKVCLGACNGLGGGGHCRMCAGIAATRLQRV